MKNFLLVTTDGYSLDDYTFYETIEEAQDALKKAYDELTPKNDEFPESSDAEMSYCNDTDAMLYTGENVYVWKIIDCRDAA